jgi:hypothetical protein
MKTKFVVLLLVVLMAGITQANMLKNPGFEAGRYGAKNVPGNWVIYSPTYTSGWSWLDGPGIADYQGAKCMQMMTNLATGAYYSTATVIQWVPVTPGWEYSFSAWAKSPSSTETAIPYGYYTWFDTASTWVGSPSYGSMLPDISSVDDNWTRIDFGSVVAPEGAAWGLFQLMGGSWNAAAGGILYDDAHLHGVIPEPVTLGLLGLGALMLRRRKKA